MTIKITITIFSITTTITITILSSSSRLPCYVFCICLLTNKYQKYKSVELGDQLLQSAFAAKTMRPKVCLLLKLTLSYLEERSPEQSGAR